MKAISFLDSPHHNARPEGVFPDLIVLHAISLPAGDFESRHVEDLFMGRLDLKADSSFQALHGVRVSAHFVVDRKGSITQFVPLQRRAWHAGKSTWLGREDCNDYSLGIEMIGDEEQAFTHAQYRETARLCRLLTQRFSGIHQQRIVGHQDISPGRKWDPGRQWDWARFQRSFARIRNVNMQGLK